MKSDSSRQAALSSGNLFAVLLIALIGNDFLDMPFYAAKYSGPSGHWAVVIAFLLFLPVVWLAKAIQNRFPGQNLFEIAPGIIGKLPALIGNLIFLSPFLIWMMLATRDGLDMILTFLLNRTPFWAVMLLLLSGVAYIAVNGLTAVSRFIAFLLIPVYVFRIVMALLIVHKIEVSHLLPLFSEPPGRYLSGSMMISGFFLPLTTIFLMMNRVNHPTQIKWIALGAMAGAFPIYFGGVIGTIGSFGAEYTQFFNWPEIAAANRVNIPYLVIEQLGLLFLIVWITAFFASEAYFFYIVASGLRWQFPALNYRLAIIGLLILAAVAVLSFPNAYVAHQLLIQVRPWLMVPVTAYPLLIYLIAAFRGKRGGFG